MEIFDNVEVMINLMCILNDFIVLIFLYLVV